MHLGPADADRLAALVLDRPPRAGHTRVLAVDGPSGSGKTTLALALLDALGRRGSAAAVLHLDHVYPGWDGLAATPPLLVDGVLAPLAAGAPAGHPRWDWAASRPAEHVPVAAADVLVVEGAGSGTRAAAPFLSLLVWLDAPALVRRDRALARDGEAYRPHWERWAAQERALFAAEGTAARADVVLRT